MDFSSGTSGSRALTGGHKDQSFIDQHPRDRPQDHRISAGHKKGSNQLLFNNK